jgi:prefoldin subunit 5
MKQKIEELLNQRKAELQSKIDQFNQLENQQRELIKEIAVLQGRVSELEELIKTFETDNKELDKS